MKHFKHQAQKDHAAKLGKFAGGGGLHHPDPMMGMPNMGGKANGGHSDVKEDKAVVRKMVKPSALTGHAHGGKAHKTPKSHKEPGPSAKELLARPVPAPVAATGPVGDIRPASPAPAGLASMMGAGGLKHGGRTTKHHMTAGAESGIGRLEKIGKKP